ncbi:hypothetical protein N7376_24450 [Brucella intermedia GD04153]|uniref:Uncharacterized protein n=1 Tax=Brucella intermedia GD04153 TaxID=2975438 RepID=A0AA42H7P6_9HYPH|nr:hypothetical protein [Brucella intermedia]MDH0127123.1 hypothetical protein [Brucella intermedia GD04153]
MMALEGVSKGALAKTIREVIRGGHGSEFLPSAPALRLLCDKNQRAVAEDLARARIHNETIEENKRLAAPRVERDEAFYERGRRRMESFHAAMKPNDEQAKENSYDAAMARLQAAAEANGHEFNIDNLKSAPSGTFKQAGRAA